MGCGCSGGGQPALHTNTAVSPYRDAEGRVVDEKGFPIGTQEQSAPRVVTVGPKLWTGR